MKDIVERIEKAIASAKDRRFIAVSIDLADAEALLACARSLLADAAENNQTRIQENAHA